MKKFYVLVIMVVALLIPTTGCYAAGPWKGKVIDAETKQPIEGAVVVAVWEKEWAGLGAGADTQYLDAEETVTDNNGDFQIPSKSFLSVPYFRKVKGPFLTIFKPAYGSFPRYQVSPTETPETLFEGKGAVVELPKLKTREERIEKLPSTPDFVPLGKVKQMLKIINLERKNLGFEPIGPKEVK